jgi:hypothetical protein
MTWSASAKFWNIKVLSARMVNKGCFLRPVIRLQKKGEEGGRGGGGGRVTESGEGGRSGGSRRGGKGGRRRGERRGEVWEEKCEKGVYNTWVSSEMAH